MCTLKLNFSMVRLSKSPIWWMGLNFLTANEIASLSDPLNNLKLLNTPLSYANLHMVQAIYNQKIGQCSIKNSDELVLERRGKN